jgi:micrococcal nuclease
MKKYIYDAVVVSVYDGDTCTAILDLGLGISVKSKLRLSGINAPERRGVSEEIKEKAQKSKEYLEKRILNKKILVHSLKKGKFGRLIAEIWVYDDEGNTPEESINKEMLREGLAEIYK